MSRWQTIKKSPPKSFPRVSGDEPTETMGAVGIVKFSPRERG